MRFIRFLLVVALVGFAAPARAQVQAAPNAVFLPPPNILCVLLYYHSYNATLAEQQLGIKNPNTPPTFTEPPLAASYRELAAFNHLNATLMLRFAALFPPTLFPESKLLYFAYLLEGRAAAFTYLADLGGEP